jgi:hypothetical protein
MWCYQGGGGEELFGGGDKNGLIQMASTLNMVWSDVVAHVHVHASLSASSAKGKYKKAKSSDTITASLCVLSDSDDSEFGPLFKYVHVATVTGYKKLKESWKVAKKMAIKQFGDRFKPFLSMDDDTDDEETITIPEVLSTVERLERAKPRTGSSILLNMLPSKVSKLLYGCTSTDCVMHFSAIGNPVSAFVQLRIKSRHSPTLRSNLKLKITLNTTSPCLFWGSSLYQLRLG